MVCQKIERIEMKYIALDLETTCLEPKKPENILMASMIYEDTALNPLPDVKELPHFTCFIKHEKYCGSAYALSLNSWILDFIAKNDENQYPILTLEQFEERACDFVDYYFDKKAVIAGKNVMGFDFQFLPSKLNNKFSHRTIDTGSVFLDWSKVYPPSSEELKNILGIPGEVSHDAYDDNVDTILALRTTYGRKTSNL